MQQGENGISGQSSQKADRIGMLPCHLCCSQVLIVCVYLANRVRDRLIEQLIGGECQPSSFRHQEVSHGLHHAYRKYNADCYTFNSLMIQA